MKKQSLTTGQVAIAKQLAREIDHDEPPGLAANILAAAVVALVRDREPKQAALMLEDVRALGAKYRRLGE